MNYNLQLFGFKEMAVRGIIGGRIHTTASILENIRSAGFTATEACPTMESVCEQISELLGPLKLRCGFQNELIEIDPDEVAIEIGQNAIYLVSFLMRSAGSLLILAHEACKDQPYHNQEPLWEFLRHCRNAAAHGGNFNLINGEPRREAEWRGLRIEVNLHSTSLFKHESSNGFLLPGDPIALLWDIEQAYPSMRV